MITDFPESHLLSFPTVTKILRFCLYANCAKTCPIPQLFEYFPVSQVPKCYLCSTVTKILPVSQLSDDLSYSPTVRIFSFHNCYRCSDVTKILLVSQLCEDISYSPTFRIFSYIPAAIFAQLLLRFGHVSQLCEDLSYSPTVRIFS